MIRPSLTILAVLIASASCGGNVSVGTGGSGASSTTSSAGTGASTSTGTVTGTGPCPATPPSGACTSDGATCTYGDSVRPDCRDDYHCLNGEWESTGGTCITPSDCPGTEPGSTTTCTDGDVCTYGNDICICDSCAEGPCMAPPAKWQCSPPPSTAGCPAVVPNSGAACSMDGLSCTYGYPCSGTGAVAQCTAGFWAWTNVACAN